MVTDREPLIFVGFFFHVASRFSSLRRQRLGKTFSPTARNVPNERRNESRAGKRNVESNFSRATGQRSIRQIFKQRNCKVTDCTVFVGDRSVNVANAVAREDISILVIDNFRYVRMRSILTRKS